MEATVNTRLIRRGQVCTRSGGKLVAWAADELASLAPTITKQMNLSSRFKQPRRDAVHAACEPSALEIAPGAHPTLMKA